MVTAGSKTLSSRRVLMQMAPAKNTVVKCGKGGGDTTDNKENIVNSNFNSTFEAREGTKNRCKVSGTPSSPAGNLQASKISVLQPRKRAHYRNERAGGPAAARSRELSPPELTTSDTFKPAKRVVGPKHTSIEGDRVKQFPKVRTPGAQSMTESCDVLVSSPKNVDNICTPELHKHSKEMDNLCTPEFHKHSTRDLQKLSKVWQPGSNGESTSKAPTHGRRLSLVKISIAREGRALKVSSAKKHISVDNQPMSASGMELSGKSMRFSAKKKSPAAEHLRKLEVEVEKARLRALERKSPATKTLVVKAGVSKSGEKHELSRKEVSPQSDSSSKSAKEGIRTRKLSTVLKSEQRLAERNEQYGLQLRQLQEQIAEKELEVERLTSAGLILNNLVKTQMEEIRELRLRLKETFNENVEVRDVCEKLDRELRLTSLKLARMHQTPEKPSGSKAVSLTTQLAIDMVELRMNETSIAEGQESSEEQEIAAQDALNGGSSDVIEEMPRITIDEEKEYTLQDLQEMVMQEENLLREKCANALRELNLPLEPLLTCKGSLDVDSLKEALASISSREDYQTTERISAVRRLSAWIGLS